ncbi:alpha-ribazole phosphatase [Fulvivirga sediminis]|uniref:Alpha-ribazole phosphatase n=1 Tax=Fulvivirga sediminis TaxID=2803949 RepID=A0A937FB06_9BACT|nr:alpha-ribazole phosphatase [Fulvivirga sediminis]MBL3657283.1 alpha-ribazole phosphatase [Fulvivirga sediminis]
MEVYFIRHTTPEVAKCICYGQSDLDVTESFEAECNQLKQQLPEKFDAVYSSPLKRCTILAQQLTSQVITDDRLKEMNFGDWEMKKWDEIPKEPLDHWMEHFVTAKTPNGESMEGLDVRVIEWWGSIKKDRLKIAVVTHAGVIRIMHAHLNNIPLNKAFENFKIGYGEIWRYDAE